MYVCIYVYVYVYVLDSWYAQMQAPRKVRKHTQGGKERERSPDKTPQRCYVFSLPFSHLKGDPEIQGDRTLKKLLTNMRNLTVHFKSIGFGQLRICHCLPWETPPRKDSPRFPMGSALLIATPPISSSLVCGSQALQFCRKEQDPARVGNWPCVKAARAYPYRMANNSLTLDARKEVFVQTHTRKPAMHCVYLEPIFILLV